MGERSPRRRNEKPSGRRRGRKARSSGGFAVRLLAAGALAASLLVWGWMILDNAGKVAAAILREDPGDLPVELLAAPRALVPGQAADADELERELRSLSYRPVARTPRDPGEYRRSGATLEVYRRAHVGPRGPVDEGFARVGFDAGRVASLAAADGRALDAFALEPVRLGAFRGPVLAERRPLPLSAYPRRLIQAVMAAEDSRFLQHRGVDPVGLLRAAWTDLRGGQMQGGSTITQQVIKNRVVGRERTLARKAHEALLAAYVERKITKERLLEIYLNEVYLGQRGAVSVVGMPAGALHYFGRNVDDLALNQEAMLAGMIASPGRFDPRRDPREAQARMARILARMRELGYITPMEEQAAAAAPLGVAPLSDPLDPAGDVLDAARRELVARGWEPRPGKARAMVFTTVDVELQAAARRALDEGLTELEAKEPSRAPLEGAVVIVRPRTGEVLALVGGRRGVRGGFHRALDARRQPGSAFKPFVALAAFGVGAFSPSSVVSDTPLAVPTAAGEWRPSNYDHQFRGPVTVRQALEQSLNVPMARVGLAVGPATVVEWAHRAGLEGHLPAQPALALGAGEVTPLDLAAGYATIAALGERRPPSLVASARTGEAGSTIPLVRVAPAERTLPADACYMVLDALTGVVERGTAKELAPLLQGARVAGKTGTTQDGRDAWFVLASGDAVVVVYIGRDDDKPAKLTGAGAAVPVVKRLIESVGPRLLSELPAAPEGMHQVEVCAETGGKATPRCPTKVLENFKEGTEPPPCAKHASPLKKLWNKIVGKSSPAAGKGRR
ncbi:transglycosylase domain-containing protein [bacterium]|nr:transglycosylase domain-containing protein [bacterium]